MNAALRLAARADVLVSNVRPAAMRRLGLGYEEVAARNPRIIYVSACGFSQKGPYADKPAYDDLIQGATSIPWLMERYGEPAPCYAPVLVGDRVTGLHTAFAVSAALYARERTGKGQAVEVPMFESVAQFVLGDHSGGHTFVPPIGAPGYSRLVSRDRRPYRTRDGWLCVLIYNDKHWRHFFEAIGRPEVFHDDERFRTQGKRLEHIDFVYGYLSRVIETRSTAYWLELFERADIPAARMYSLDDILCDEHLQATGQLQKRRHPTEGELWDIAVPTEWSESKPESRRHAPALGEHTHEVLAEHGLSQAQIDALIENPSLNESERDK